jgi:hypothetical protein
MGDPGKTWLEVTGWNYEFAADAVPCLYCGNSERVVLRNVLRPEVGVCEACSAHLYWIWRKLSGDAPPRAAADSLRPARVKVVVSRLGRLPSGQPNPPDTPYSYEVGFVSGPGPDGSLDLPTADLQPGEEEVAAAERALASAGAGTWPCMLEPLYAAHTPRGSLARVYLARAYVLPERKEDDKILWRGWPPWDHARGMEGFYLALRDVWQLRINSHLARDPRTAELSVLVRRGAHEYVKIQQALRSGARDVDTSMAEYLRRSMTDDEKWVDRVLREEHEKLAAADAEKAEAAASAVVPGDAEPGSTGFEEELAAESGPEGEADLAGEEDAGGDDEPTI